MVNERSVCDPQQPYNRVALGSALPDYGEAAGHSSILRRNRFKTP